MTTVIQHPLPEPKKIRFVNNQGQPPSKRRRINAACLTCRKRKTRCAGERPFCSTCTKNGHDCLGYTDIDKKRDNGSGSGVSTGRTSIASSSGTPSSASNIKLEVDGDDGIEVENDGIDTHGDFLDDETFISPSFVTGDDQDVNDADGDEDDRGTNSHSPASTTSRNQLPERADAQPDGRASSRSPRQLSSLANPETASMPQAISSTTGQDNDNQHHPPRQQSPQRQQQKPRTPGSRRAKLNRSVSFVGKRQNPASHSSLLMTQQQEEEQQQHYSGSHRVPYFRYFGPTAIVPGYKQMVVDLSVRSRRRSRGNSFSATSTSSSTVDGIRQQQHNLNTSFSYLGSAFEGTEDLPGYDPNDPNPVHPLIMSLLRTFFVHLGCNYPFLRQDRVLRMVRERRAAPILVDSMCALAARFSDHPIFTGESDGEEPKSRSDYGNVFAQRAKAATVDTFPCPTVGAVQAYLLMAYEGFGADQDSALWMYLGLAIRMAVDLGIQKIVGIQQQRENNPWYTRIWNRKNKRTGDGGSNNGDNNTGDNIQEPRSGDEDEGGNMGDDESFDLDEQHATEQERVDTFWAVFFLDRVISSGTGRPVTFRDGDFEHALPESTLDSRTDWPVPFPTLVQIIHLYGRISDVLNNIRSVEDLTQEKMDRLAQMENDLTELYQRQDPRLHFNATNFQQYVRAGQGTTFILVHFWFHALIIILHQPTLLTPFASLERVYQILPNSHELSMSSAKTIADILSFAELIDPKSFIGNPFTSQPMYIAACAFLMESIANASQPVSQDTTPPPETREGRRPGAGGGISNMKSAGQSKHSLLALNASQNYQRCYKSLQQMHVYWGGVRYILSALDQKAKGIWDCETYTSEEYGNTKLPRRNSFSRLSPMDNPTSPSTPPIAWSLTGTTNSSNPSLTLLFQSNQSGNSHGALGGQQQNPSRRHQQALQQHRREKRRTQEEEQTQPQSQPQPQPHHDKHSPQQSHQYQHHAQPSQCPPAFASSATTPGDMSDDLTRRILPEVPNMFPSPYPQANVSAVRYSAIPMPQQNHQNYNHGSPSSSTLLTSPTMPYQYSRTQPSSLTAESQGLEDRSGYFVVPVPSQSQGQNQNYDQNQQPNSGHHDVRRQHNYNYHQSSSNELPSPQQQLCQPLPVPVQSQPFRTSPPHNSSCEPSILPSASTALDSASSSFFASPMNHPTDSMGILGHGFSPDGFDGGSYSYFGNGPITDAITFDSQEIDISTLNLPNEIPQQWLAYLPGDVIDLFGNSPNSAGQ